MPQVSFNSINKLKSCSIITKYRNKMHFCRIYCVFYAILQLMVDLHKAVNMILCTKNIFEFAIWVIYVAIHNAVFPLFPTRHLDATRHRLNLIWQTQKNIHGHVVYRLKSPKNDYVLWLITMLDMIGITCIF